MASPLEVSALLKVTCMHGLRVIFECFLTLILVVLLPLRWLIQSLLGYSGFSVWCGQPIIAMAVNCRAERLLGVKSLSIVTHTYFVTQAFDWDVSRISRSRIFRYVTSWVLLSWVLLFAKRVHTYCDGGLLASTSTFAFNPRELFLYRLARLTHIAWAYGADVRTRLLTQALGEPNCCTECDAPGKYCVCDQEKANANLARLKKSAVMICTIGDMNEYLPLARHDLHYWPLDLSQHSPDEEVASTRIDKPLRIVHAPNHRQFKGSRHLISAVEQLKKEGFAIDLVLVERVPNDEAIQIYRTADIVFDQCLIGFHGYFALEAMALSKPVMVFIRKPDYLIDAANCPLINVNPDTILDRLRHYLANRDDLVEIGFNSRKYVEQNYGLDSFALRLKNAYNSTGIRL